MSGPETESSDSSKGTGPASRARRRVVILVDNDVHRDSRVQKQAVSMSELGWDVRLLGLAPDGETARWRLGGARVRLIRVVMHRRQYEARDPRWRNPFAYGTSRQQEQRRLSLDRRRADVALRMADARLRQPTRGAVGRQLSAACLLPARALNKALAACYDFRQAQAESVKRKRRTMTSPLDRFTTWWLKTRHGRRAWRWLDSHLWDLEASYGPVIDALDPDLIHANDFRMLGVGARAKMRAALRGKRVPLVWDAHEFLPGTRPWNSHPRWHVAQLAHEREFAALADEVVTVSDELGRMLHAEHKLPRQPETVLNCPLSSNAPRPPEAKGVRELVGVGQDTPILVYSGSPSRQRGLGTVVEALPQLEGVVVALVVAVPESAPIQEVLDRARELGVDDRVHLLPYVPPEDVVEYLSTADVGLIPIQHYPNHEIALITKFFEYSHAKLPIVVSDVRTMSAEVQETGQGEVFIADDVDDFARAVRKILADPARYRRFYETNHEQLADWTWERQALVLDKAYRRALTAPRRLT